MSAPACSPKSTDSAAVIAQLQAQVAALTQQLEQQRENAQSNDSNGSPKSRSPAVVADVLKQQVADQSSPLSVAAAKIASSALESVRQQGIEGSASQGANDPFYSTPDEMSRTAVTALVKALEPFLSRDGTSCKVASSAPFDPLMNQAIPRQGSADMSLLLKRMEPLFASIHREDHPGFMAQTQDYHTFVSSLGWLLTAAYNPILAVEWKAPGFNTLQQLVVKWLCQIVGYTDEDTGGHAVSCGTEANEICMAAAVAKYEASQDYNFFRNAHQTGEPVQQQNRLEVRKKAVLYASKSSHQCILGSANALGFDASQVVFIPNLGPAHHFKMDPRALERQIEVDRAAGRVPFFLSACAGSTMMAAYDDFNELADICQRESIWLHGDGAWGGASLLIPEGKACLKGVERTDSFVLDPHKGLYEPYGLGVALVKRKQWLKSFFSNTSYKHADLKANQPDYDSRVIHDWKDYGRQCSQPCKIIGLYMSLEYYGLAKYEQAVQLSWTQASQIARKAREPQRSRNWRVLIEPRFAMLTLQYVEDDLTPQEINKVNEIIVRRVCDEGVFFPNSNRFLDDSGAEQLGIRMVCMNPWADGFIDKIFESLEREGKAACPAARVPRA